MDLIGSNLGVNTVVSWHFSGRTDKNYEKLVRIPSVSAEI
jgi:hypothetical protein